MFSAADRPKHNRHIGLSGDFKDVGIGDYLLYAVAYRWVKRLIYCGNPNEECNDYLWQTLKNFKGKTIRDKPVQNTIQLLHNLEELNSLF